jgi:hypothetical protein
MALTPFTVDKIVILGTSIANYTFDNGLNKEFLLGYISNKYGVTVTIDNQAVPGSNTGDLKTAIEGGLLTPYIGETNTVFVMIHGVNDYAGAAWQDLSLGQQTERIDNLNYIYSQFAANSLRLVQCSTEFINYLGTTLDNDPTNRVNEINAGLYTYVKDWIVPAMQTYAPDYLQDIGGGQLWPMIDGYNSIRNITKSWNSIEDPGDIIHPGSIGRAVLGLEMVDGIMKISQGTAPEIVQQRNYNDVLPVASAIDFTIATGRKDKVDLITANINKTALVLSYEGPIYHDSLIDSSGTVISGAKFYSWSNGGSNSGSGNTTDPSDNTASIYNNALLLSGARVTYFDGQMNYVVTGLEAFKKYNYRIAASASTAANDYTAGYQWAGQLTADVQSIDAGSATGDLDVITGTLETDYAGRVILAAQEINVNNQQYFSGLQLLSDGPTNTPPTADAGPDQSNIAAGATVTLDFSGSTDSDGTITTYTVTQTAGSTVSLSGTGATRTFIAPTAAMPQTLTFSLVVTDNNDTDSEPDTVNIGVLAQVTPTPKPSRSRVTVSQRQIKVSKTDVVGIDVSDWANGDTITTLAVTNADGLLTVNSTSISGDIMLVSITGVAEGAAVLDFEYETATRNECTELTVYVIEDC